MIEKFQIVILDNQDFIIEYRSYTIAQMKALEMYISHWLTIIGDHGINIKITRWDNNGNRI